MKSYFDTNVLVAAFVRSHPHHRVAAAAVRRVVEGHEEGCISAHGLAELFSVLTRAPFVPRILPVEAWELIGSLVLSHFEVLALAKEDYRGVLEQCSRRGVSGGRVFDALHIEAARKSACERLLTFNFREFEGLSSAPSGWVTEPTF